MTDLEIQDLIDKKLSQKFRETQVAFDTAIGHNHDGKNSRLLSTGTFSMVRVYNDNTQALTQAGYTTVIFNQEDYDTQSEYDTATGIFTAKNAGKYHVDLHLQLAERSWAAGTYMLTRIVAGGNNYQQEDETTATATVARFCDMSMDVALTAGQTINISVYTDPGSGTTIYANGLYNWLSIHRIV